jgi:sigma-E factor negative regulatory protein RseB
VSIFIEPAASRSQVHSGQSQQGAINIYTRTIDDQVVTVLGEAPASTVRQIADSISFRGR